MRSISYWPIPLRRRLPWRNTPSRQPFCHWDHFPRSLHRVYAWDIFGGFGVATVEAGKAVVSIIPGVDLTGSEKNTEDTALSAALRANFSALAAVAFVAFVLLYVPCVATLAAIRQEYGTRWMAFATVFQLALAWVVAFAIYQGGKLLGLG